VKYRNNQDHAALAASVSLLAIIASQTALCTADARSSPVIFFTFFEALRISGLDFSNPSSSVYWKTKLPLVILDNLLSQRGDLF